MISLSWMFKFISVYCRGESLLLTIVTMTVVGAAISFFTGNRTNSCRGSSQEDDEQEDERAEQDFQGKDPCLISKRDLDSAEVEAIKAGNLNILEILLKDINTKKNNDIFYWSGITLMHYAAAKGDQSIVVFLIKRGCPVHEKINHPGFHKWNHFTPFEVACCMGRTEVACIILNTLNARGRDSLLWLAAAKYLAPQTSCVGKHKLKAATKSACVLQRLVQWQGAVHKIERWWRKVNDGESTRSRAAKKIQTIWRGYAERKAITKAKAMLTAVGNQTAMTDRLLSLMAANGTYSKQVGSLSFKGALERFQSNTVTLRSVGSTVNSRSQQQRTRQLDDEEESTTDIPNTFAELIEKADTTYFYSICTANTPFLVFSEPNCISPIIADLRRARDRSWSIIVQKNSLTEKSLFHNRDGVWMMLANSEKTWGVKTAYVRVDTPTSFVPLPNSNFHVMSPECLQNLRFFVPNLGEEQPKELDIIKAEEIQNEKRAKKLFRSQKFDVKHFVQIRNSNNKPYEKLLKKSLEYGVTTQFIQIVNARYAFDDLLYLGEELGNVLHECARNGQAKAIAALFTQTSLSPEEENLLINGQNKLQETPLMTAIRYGEPDCCNMLLKAGANPRFYQAVCPNADTPMHTGFVEYEDQNGILRATRVMLMNTTMRQVEVGPGQYEGCALENLHPTGWGALQQPPRQVVCADHLADNLLLQPWIKTHGFQWSTLLQAELLYTTSKKDKDVAVPLPTFSLDERLLELYKNSKGFSIATMAAHYNQGSILKLLHGHVDLGELDPLGMSPLLRCLDKAPHVEALWETQLSSSATNKTPNLAESLPPDDQGENISFSWTPPDNQDIDTTVKEEESFSFSWEDLRSCGQHVEKPGDDLNDLIEATYDTVKLLLTLGVPVNQIGPDDVTPLMLAARWPTGKLVSLLLEAGADMSMEDIHGNTALTLGASSSAEVVDVLLEQGRTERRKHGGSSNQARVLMAAYEPGQVKTIEALLSSGIVADEVAPVLVAQYRDNTCYSFEHASIVSTLLLQTVNRAEAFLSRVTLMGLHHHSVFKGKVMRQLCRETVQAIRLACNSRIDSSVVCTHENTIDCEHCKDQGLHWFPKAPITTDQMIGCQTWDIFDRHVVQQFLLTYLKTCALCKDHDGVLEITSVLAHFPWGTNHPQEKLMVAGILQTYQALQTEEQKPMPDVKVASIITKKKMTPIVKLMLDAQGEDTIDQLTSVYDFMKEIIVKKEKKSILRQAETKEEVSLPFSAEKPIGKVKAVTFAVDDDPWSASLA